MIFDKIYLNLFFYFVMSFLVVAIIMPYVIPLLKKMKFGQSIREEGPKEHFKKAGTPTMGGLIILLSIFATSAIGLNFTHKSIAVLISLFLFGIIGFLDDYIKIGFKRNLGLTAKQKMFMQIIFAFIVSIICFNISSEIKIPFYGYLELGYIYIIFAVVFIVGVSNSVNLTDGLDGLSSGIISIVMMFYTYYAYKTSSIEISFISISILGASLGFLLYNKNPAKIFMGDVGSLALGAGIATISLMLKDPIILALVGGVFLAETLSVIIQVSYYKKTKKRIFKMSPLHHHYELSGWKETKVVKVFWLVSVLLSLIGFIIVWK